MTTTLEPTEKFSNMSILGIIGGMGIVASSKFHNLICDLSANQRVEQDQICTLLISSPNIPDRTKSILSNNTKDLITRVEYLLEQMSCMSVSHVIICCYTAHIILNECNIPKSFHLISLVDYAKRIVDKKQGSRVIILCTSACSINKVFGVSESLIYPTEGDQIIIDKLIELQKTDNNTEKTILCFDGILKKYDFDSILLGCTDLHSLYECVNKRYSKYNIIDPLQIMAHEIVNSWNK